MIEDKTGFLIATFAVRKKRMLLSVRRSWDVGVE